MNNSEKPARASSPGEDTPAKGPNLVLIYSLLALALVAAIGFAVAIVWPFYLRR